MDPAVKPRDDGRSRIIDQNQTPILHHNITKSILENAMFSLQGAMCNIIPTQPASTFYEKFVCRVDVLGSQKTYLVAMLARVFWC